jgi:hypothetical protein
MKKETADYSAITTWGVFYPEEGKPANLILLDCVKERYEFPELRRIALGSVQILETRDGYHRSKSIRTAFDV